MTKLFIAGFLSFFAVSAFAEINCQVNKGEESISILVIDTFVDRTAFITRIHPSIHFPTLAFSVRSTEKAQMVNFMNEEAGFNLSISKLFYQRSLPPLYRGELQFGEITTHMYCTVD